MVTPVNITITMDNSGVVTVANQTGDVLRKIAPPSQKIRQEFDGIESAERRAHVAGTLFTRLTGVEMPRAMETVISRSRVVGPLLAGMFNASIIATAGVALIEVGKRIGGLIDLIGGNTDAIKEMGKAAADAAQDAFWNPKTLSVAVQHMGELQQRIDQLRKTAKFNPNEKMGPLDVSPDVVNAQELEHIDKNHEAFLQNINKLQHEHNALIDAETAKANEAGKQGFALLAQQRQDFLESKEMLVMKTQQNAQYTELVTLNERRFQGERMALEREGDSQVIALRHQVLEESQTGIGKIRQLEADAIADVIRKRDVAHTLLKGQAAEEIALIHQRASEQQRITLIELKGQQRDAELFARTRAASFLKGSDQIIEQADIEKQTIINGLVQQTEKAKEIGPELVLSWMNASVKLLAIDEATTRQIEMNHIQLRDKTIDLQQQAAIGALPEWQRAEAMIRLEHDKTYQELNRLEMQDVAGFAQYEAQKAAADQLMNDHLIDAHKQLTEQLGSDLQSVFDDITSGNIGKRILANMEKFFFQIVAQWILSINIMKSAFGQLAGIALFGPGSTGANVFGGGGNPLSLIGSVLGLGGSSSQSAQVAAAASSASSSVTIPGMVGGTTSGLSAAIAGTGATANSALVPSASNALTSSTMADAALPGLVGGTTSQLAGKSSFLGGLFSTKTLAGLTPLAAMALGAAGGKAGMVGGLITSLLLTGKLGALIQPFTLGAGALGTAAVSAITGALTGGLIGFGIGSGHGGLLGSLAGAGTGALAGLMVGGPIGALVGGLVGLLGGIFGGIFGGSKRKKQANALFDNTISPDIAQIITGFDGFQVDSNSAIQQLEQLRTDAQKQFSALKSQGKDVFSQKVGPAIDSAEKHIRDTQSERDRRSAIPFGPPQFATGGMFSTMGGNAGLAVLHDGEFVVNQKSTTKHRGALEKINAGGAAGSHIEVHIHPDAFDRAYVRSQQFEKDITTALNRASVEGRW